MVFDEHTRMLHRLAEQLPGKGLRDESIYYHVRRASLYNFRVYGYTADYFGNKGEVGYKSQGETRLEGIMHRRQVSVDGERKLFRNHKHLPLLVRIFVRLEFKHDPCYHASQNLVCDVEGTREIGYAREEGKIVRYQLGTVQDQPPPELKHGCFVVVRHRSNLVDGVQLMVVEEIAHNNRTNVNGTSTSTAANASSR
eukprot:CAMPEP_0167809266 /NCGR_PEP_ID=MMETSP0111_2-20121227/23689_1 /TAXON_ID=91324 /ORGANISM="Lotharella globosa, Strain CCCM811" /LENGTH=196 /DNA_ID=CAMNT_0007707613 /DNA_START=38 /DNA_END=625 /DNA_ORIENTATION=-